VPLLAGVVEIEPWLHQWHHAYDAAYGSSPAEFYRAFLDDQLTPTASPATRSPPGGTDHRTPDPKVAGSFPAPATKYSKCWSEGVSVRRHPSAFIGMQPLATRSRLDSRGDYACVHSVGSRGGVVSTQRADQPEERRLPTREEVLERGKPFPPYEEMIIEGLTDEEEAAFLKAIAEA